MQAPSQRIESSSTSVSTSRAKLTVAGMGSCYALGTFTDNFYKQCAVLLAASLQLTTMQSYATVLFSLPFILFSAWAGWLADRLPKKDIVVAAKATEMIALFIGGFVLVQGFWPGILAVLFFMGLQATFFSPALNGSIPEVFPPGAVPRVNSFIKLASTAAVLAGMAIAGLFLDFRPSPPLASDPAGKIYFDVAPDLLASYGITRDNFGRAAAGIFIFLVTILGLLVALPLRRTPSAKQRGLPLNPFPLAGPLDSLRHFMDCRQDPSLFLVLQAEAFFYGIAAITVISISNLASALGYSETITSLLSAALMIGIAVGAILAGRGHAESWKTNLLPSSLGMSAFLLLTALAPCLDSTPWFEGVLSWQLTWIVACLFSCGLCGGMYLIPLASYIQVRPKAEDKGKVIGISNFFSFVGIALFGVLFFFISIALEYTGTALQAGRLFAPAGIFVIYSLMTICFGFLVVARNLRKWEKSHANL